MNKVSSPADAIKPKNPGIKGGKAAQIAACFEISRRLENYKPEPKYQDKRSRRRI